MKSSLTKQRIKMKAPERAKNFDLYAGKNWKNHIGCSWGETRPPLIYRLKRISPTRYEDDIVDVNNDKWSASVWESWEAELLQSIEKNRKRFNKQLDGSLHLMYRKLTNDILGIVLTMLDTNGCSSTPLKYDRRIDAMLCHEFDLLVFESKSTISFMNSTIKKITKCR